MRKGHFGGAPIAALHSSLNDSTHPAGAGRREGNFPVLLVGDGFAVGAGEARHFPAEEIVVRVVVEGEEEIYKWARAHMTMERSEMGLPFLPSLLPPVVELPRPPPLRPRPPRRGPERSPGVKTRSPRGRDGWRERRPRHKSPRGRRGKRGRGG